MHKIKRYGWIPDLPDARDDVYAVSALPSALPEVVDLRPHCPPVYDQGDLGSCTGNAIAAAIQFERRKQNLSDLIPSRLFIYYNERQMEGTVNEDSGASVRDGIKSVAKLGVCPEGEWPYEIERFAERPPEACYANALAHRVVRYSRVPQAVAMMRSCLALGYPFVFGFTAYESFESAEVARSGIVQMPEPGEVAVGGHAVLAVGYQHGAQRLLVRNSWGLEWGQGGYFTIPYTYITNPNLSDDLWTVRLLSA
jgi:C1A family cysteine protease